MNEYQDQDVWYDLYGFNGERWVYIADFDTYGEAAAERDQDEGLIRYQDYKIQRMYGLSE